ncbi:hypothetical protein [Micromonospora nigra]|nr:hypothetical protein [Micromonospora nigra]
MVGALVLAGAAPVRAGDETFIEVTPNSAQAGTRVNLRASCDNVNDKQAEVTSEAFDRVFLRPENGFLTGSVTIPGDRPAGSYPVNLRCDNGNTDSTTLTVLNMEQPSKGPATGGGGTAGGTGSVLLLGGAGLVVATVVFGLVSSRRRAGTGS